ncbi:MAG: hypothetical protein KUG83_00375 [Gammaproteobacteria bacterium]|nr:hypothetical protein [Gammaproteobacteria bacterium]
MIPPDNTSIPKLVEETGVSNCTLYVWHKEARIRGLVVLGDGKNAENWSASDKFSVVLEAAAMIEAELAEYRRSKGLYVGQIAVWKQACIQANSTGKDKDKAK